LLPKLKILYIPIILISNKRIKLKQREKQNNLK
jgi:hypothetical protein